MSTPTAERLPTRLPSTGSTGRDRVRALDMRVVVPVYNGGLDLGPCIDSLIASGQMASRIIIVDDASTDGVAETTARTRGTAYLRLDNGPNGPARARNAGAASCPEADVYAFIDADVTVKPDTLQRFDALLLANPDIEAAFGSYDDNPSAPGIVSRYKNLLHHFMHQTGSAEASTFWSGCGVVRADAFHAMGGFDERFAKASIEDVDLGLRLTDAGHRVRLCADIQCRHHKRWSVESWLRTDIFARALPWSRLLARRGQGVPDTLNLGHIERLSALCALLAVASPALLLFEASRPFAVIAGLLAVAGFVGLQRPLLNFFRRREGRKFAAIATLLHGCYFIYSSLVFAGVQVRARLSPDWRAAR